MRNSLCLLYLCLKLTTLSPIHATPCDEYNNEYQRYDNGKCPTSTSYHSEKGCCVGCPLCGPGWKKSPNCRGPCLRCLVDLFSELQDNLQCFPCTRCEDLNRVYEHPCYPAQNARCGDCLPGYFTHDESGETNVIKCIKCDYPNHHRLCEKQFTQILTTSEEDFTSITTPESATNEVTQPSFQPDIIMGADSQQDEKQHLLSWPIIVLVVISMLVILAGLGFIYKRCRKTVRRSQSSSDPSEEQYRRTQESDPFIEGHPPGFNMIRQDSKDYWHIEILNEKKNTIFKELHITDSVLQQLVEHNLVARKVTDRIKRSSQADQTEWFYNFLKTVPSDVYITCRQFLENDGQSEVLNILPEQPPDDGPYIPGHGGRWTEREIV